VRTEAKLKATFDIRKAYAGSGSMKWGFLNSVAGPRIVNRDHHLAALERRGYS
jgi:hypothetical protein